MVNACYMLTNSEIFQTQFEDPTVSSLFPNKEELSSNIQKLETNTMSQITQKAGESSFVQYILRRF